MEVTTATRPVRLTAHAVARYRERVKPALSRGACKRELTFLAQTGLLMEELPFDRYGDEVAECDRLPEPDAYIELAPKIFAVVEFDANGCAGVLTVLIDGCLSPPRRRSRNEAKRAHRRARRRERNRRFFENGLDKGPPKIEWR